jgi:hypothetical protein
MGEGGARRRPARYLDEGRQVVTILNSLRYLYEGVVNLKRVLSRGGSCFALHCPKSTALTQYEYE